MQNHSESAARAEFAFAKNLATYEAGKFLRKVQAEPGAFMAAIESRIIDLAEGPEELGLIGFAYADAGVGDADLSDLATVTAVFSF